jgi:hypothetical protein
MAQLAAELVGVEDVVSHEENTSWTRLYESMNVGEMSQRRPVMHQSLGG